MHNALIIIFIVSLGLIVHTYLLYPGLMILFFGNRKGDPKAESNSGSNQRSLLDAKATGETDLPEVAVLVAAHNEASVIRRKIESVLQSDYPMSHVHVFVGSDASSDDTEKIIRELCDQWPAIHLSVFRERIGKISVINHLHSLAQQEVLIMTDANVIFEKSTLRELVHGFTDPAVGMVAGNVVKVSKVEEGVSFQEKKYLSFENRIKAAESNAFGLVMGAEGGCYAIRNELFTKVPIKFNVDDFYITLQVLRKGSKVIFNANAICHEDTTGDSRGEYRRKVRISSGNFQNLFFFRNLLWKFWSPIGFSFWSHKVLRWFTPFLLILCLLSSVALAVHSPFFMVLSILQVLLLLMPLIDTKIKFTSEALKFVSHFYLMNMALLSGFFRYIKGINDSIWQPVERNV